MAVPARVEAGRLPTFVVIGAQKTGTTSLWRHLCVHPEVAMATVKEPNFFLGGPEWERGVTWYRTLFADADGATAVGEASTMYSMFPHAAGVPERMHQVVPDVRIVYVVRHPIDRMVSLYGHHRAAGWERRPIAQALLQDARYADTSRYAMQLERYTRVFDPEQLLVVRTEDLAHDPAGTVRRVWRHLGVADDVPITPGALDHRANTREDQRVPKGWWSALGRVLVATVPDSWVPDLVVRHNRHRWVTRPLRPEERVIDDEVRSRLEDLLRPDLERFVRWLAPGDDAWGLLG